MRNGLPPVDGSCVVTNIITLLEGEQKLGTISDTVSLYKNSDDLFCRYKMYEMYVI